MSARRRVAGVFSPPMRGLRSAPAFAQPNPTLRELPAVVAQSVLRHRRVVAAGCVALAVAIGVDALTPARPAAARVVAAAHDLAAGTVLKPDDVRWVALPVAVEPTGALTAMSDVLGRAIVGPVRSGEPITDVRLDEGGSAGGTATAPLAPPGDGLVAAPVRLADAQAAGLLRVGERVDVLAATPSSGATTSAVSATVVADDVRVLAVPASTDGGDASLGAATGDGALVVLATTPDEARALAQAELTAQLSAVVVR